jgi:DNA-binding Lrp family transcriptional regulator
MGRPEKEIDIDSLVDLASKGLTQKELAAEFDVSIPTIASRIAKLQEEQGVLLQYRSIRNLHLTKLQARCLEAVSPAKINAASMLDLVRAFKILHDAETETKENGKVRGLVAYLLQIEKEEASARLGVEISDDALLEMTENSTERGGIFSFSGEIEL